jgi:hypothetical protein
MRKPTQYVRWLYELLFSLYWAVQIVAAEEVKEGSRLLTVLQAPLVFLDHLRRRALTDFEPHLFYGAWLLLALIVFVCLRLLAQITLVNLFLCYLVGCVTLVGPLYAPILESSHLVNGLYVYTGEGHLLVARWEQWLEVAAVVVCVFLYLYRKGRVHTALSIVIPLFHFAFWGAIIFGGDWRDYLWQVAAFLLVPFCTTLVWGLYVRLLGGSILPSQEAADAN